MDYMLLLEENDMKYLKAIWQFCSYLFVPQWGRNKKKEPHHIDVVPFK